jgi:hypothetical protein
MHQGGARVATLCRVPGKVQRGDGRVATLCCVTVQLASGRPGAGHELCMMMSRRGKGVGADRRILELMTLDVLVSFPLCPLTTPRTVAYEMVTERGGGGVWGSSHQIKVKRDLDPDIAWMRSFRVWRFGGVKLKPTKLEFFGVLGRSPGAVRTAAWKRLRT